MLFYWTQPWQSRKEVEVRQSESFQLCNECENLCFTPVHKMVRRREKDKQQEESLQRGAISKPFIIKYWSLSRLRQFICLERFTEIEGQNDTRTLQS